MSIIPEENWGDDVHEEHDYTCVSTRDFAPLLTTALKWAHGRSLGPEATTPGLLPGDRDLQALAGLELLSELSGVDKKVLKRIAQHEVLIVELRTVDAVLTCAGMHFDHDLVIPKGRRAARRMAEDEANARPFPTPESALQWRTEELFQGYLRAIEDPPTPFLSHRERRNASMKRTRAEQKLGRQPTEAEVDRYGDDAVTG